MGKPTVALFCMPEDGHFRQLRPIIFGLVRGGFDVRVFTHRRFGPEVERCGGSTIDLFGKYPLESADAESVPIPCRYVSFAAVYAEDVLEELKKIRPVLVVYETFAVIGRLTAQLLGVPFVNVSAGHNLDPARYLSMLRTDPRVRISERCHRAVEILRERYGQSDASPFSYVTGLSPHLNICCEPANFLTEEERRTFEPVAFYGCLSVAEGPGPQAQDKRLGYFDDRRTGLRLYACLGTAAPKYYPDAAIGLLQTVSDAVESMPQVRALISLGGVALKSEVLRLLEKPNVEVVEFADQWEVLKISDVFVTHHGLNSTHEAIFHRVLMLSYPMFMDQPSLAERCRQFGLAMPLTDTLRGPVDAAQFRLALATLSGDREDLKAAFERARSWELEVIEQRSSCIARIFDLASVRQPGS